MTKFSNIIIEQNFIFSPKNVTRSMTSRPQQYDDEQATDVRNRLEWNSLLTDKSGPGKAPRPTQTRRIVTSLILTGFAHVVSDPCLDHVGDLLVVLLKGHRVTIAENSDIRQVNTRRVSA
jgi:hypothetical protein